MLSTQEGKKLLNIAKNSISSAFSGMPYSVSETSDNLNRKTGVFVTLYHNKELRGCIGFIESGMPLWKSVAEAARLSAFEDPRFPPLRKEELGKIRFEISVLTPPKMIKNKKRALEISIGKDGLIVEQKGRSGLLLPQVATEYGWNRNEFLEHTCTKAGLPTDAWKDEETEIYIFSADIF